MVNRDNIDFSPKIFIAYIGKCSILYIDYQIKNTGGPGAHGTSGVDYKKIKKIISFDEKDGVSQPNYIDANGNKIKIPFGEIIL